MDRYDQQRHCFDHVPVDENNKYVIDIACSSQDRICIVTRRDLLELDPAGDRFLRKIQLPTMTLSEPQVFFDSNDHLWLRLDNALLCYDEHFNVLFRNEYPQISSRAVYDGTKFIWVTVEEFR